MTAIRVFTIHRCACIPPGTRFYLKGKEPLAVSTRERRDFLALFGLTESTPAGADAIALAPGDYEETIRELEGAEG